MHIELFLEEPSAEAFLEELMPKIVPPDTSWRRLSFRERRTFWQTWNAV
jgi:hypothetical protein